MCFAHITYNCFIKRKKTIECGHTFCKDCILKWVCLRGNCPLCRSVVTDPTVKLDSVNFGVKNKLLVIIERYNLNISDLDENDQTLLSMLGIEPTLCMYEEDWNNIKSYISEELFEKITKIFSYTVMKVDNEHEWEYYTKFNKLYLFD